MSKSDQKPEQPLRAAALKYDKEKNNAPCVVAAGTGYAAERIIRAAIENGINIYHDDTAATILTELDLGREIPPELYQIVADIYVSLMDAAEEQKDDD